MRRRVLVWATAAGLALALLLFARYAYPPPGTDAPSFLASAINLRLGRGLVNPFYPQMAFADPSGARRHIYYPPLFPLVVSALMAHPTPRDAFLAVAWLRAGSVVLSCALLLALARRAATDEGGSPTALLIAASLCGLCTNWLPTLGRPEALATLFVLLAALSALRVTGAALVVLLGVLTGLVAATQPFGAIELTAVIGLAHAVREETRTTLARTAVVAAIGLAVFAGVVALSPHGLRETLAGMARAYPHTPWADPPGEGWWRPWLTARRSTFYGPLFVLALACGADLLRRRGRLGSRVAFGGFALALAACVYHGSLTHDSLRNYNLLLLSPLAFATVVVWFAASRSWVGARWTRWARAAGMVFVLATAAGFVGHLVSFPFFLARARGLEEARAAWRTVPLPAAQRIVFMGNLWPLSEDYDRMELLSAAALGDAIRRRPVPVLVLGRRREHRGVPTPLPGFVLLRDAFNPRPFRGPLRYFLEEDYSFAVYLPSAPLRGAP